MNNNEKFSLLNNLRDTFNLLNIKNSDEDFTNAISSNISIQHLFEIHNLNVNLQYLIISMPKTGNNYILNIIQTFTNDVHFFHSIIEFLYIDLRFINYTIQDIILFISSNTTYEKLYIIISYREPTSRYISRYLWNIKIGLNNINILKDVKIIDNYIYEQIKNDDISCMNILNEFNINLSNYNYDSISGYKLIDYNNKISFLLTKIDDFDNMILNFFKINIDKKLIFKNENELNNKIIIFEDSIKTKIYTEEYVYLKFYNFI